jgi:anti-sigma B factor antagonist
MNTTYLSTTSPDGATTTVLRLDGDLDVAAAPVLRKVINALIELGHDTIVLDLASVGFVDAAAIGMLAACERRARRSGSRIVLGNVPQPIARVLQITALDRVLAMEDVPVSPSDRHPRLLAA